jgi:hypothetical protein
LCKSGPAAEAAAVTEVAAATEAVQFGVAPCIAGERLFEGEQQLWVLALIMAVATVIQTIKIAVEVVTMVAATTVAEFIVAAL